MVCRKRNLKENREIWKDMLNFDMFFFMGMKTSTSRTNCGRWREMKTLRNRPQYTQKKKPERK